MPASPAGGGVVVVLVPHVPDWHVWKRLHAWQAAPAAPHAVGSVPPAQAPDALQHPVQFAGPQAAPSSAVVPASPGSTADPSSPVGVEASSDGEGVPSGGEELVGEVVGEPLLVGLVFFPAFWTPVMSEPLSPPDAQPKGPANEANAMTGTSAKPQALFIAFVSTKLLSTAQNQIWTVSPQYRS